MNLMKKRLRTVYLYPDGHAVCCWEKYDREAGTVEWVEIHEQWGPAVGFETGRLILSGSLALLLKGVRAVNAKTPTVERGSEKTKELGLALDSLEVLPRGTGIDWPVVFNGLPGVLSAEWTFQPEVETETFEEVREAVRWSLSNVAKVHYRRRKKTTA